jgi:hypothetical protein
MLETYRDTITMDTPQLDTIVTKPTTISLSIGGLLLPNLTLKPDNQITTRITILILLTYSDSPILITGLPQINASNTRYPPINTLNSSSSLTTIGPPIKGLKKPKKVTKSKEYHILEESEERDTSKIIFHDVVPRNIIEGKRNTKRGTALLAY